MNDLYTLYLAANNFPQLYTIDDVMRWAALALRESTARADAATWQPIETAPKDGTKIFVYRHGWSQAPIASWGEYPGNPIEGITGAEVYMSGWVLDDAWLYLGLEDGFLGWNEDIDNGDMPTHWMPLPKAPEQGEGDGQE